MLKIFKYEIPINDYFTLALPEGAKVLKVECQGEMPCLWALVDPDKISEKRKFRFAGTGHPITEDESELKFISTFQMRGGALIFHIFEVVA